ncbi:MAG: HDOD domain-containing protein [Planctomycetes bacterium]|nr:HDOD domain-containing protein [Planctomycetota bacterium]
MGRTNGTDARRRDVHILVADPNPRVSQILDLALRELGYVALTAENGVMAYLKALQLRPDVILADAALPPYGGVRLAESLRGNAVSARVPLIIKVPGGDERWEEAARRAGAAGTLGRPLRFSEFRRTVETLLRGAGKAPPLPGDAEVDAGAEHRDDMALLRDPKVVASEKLDLIARRASKLGAFPFVVARALAISSDEKSGARELAEVIRSDVGLAANILKLANTPHFARRGRAIAEVAEAIVRIGFRATKQLVLAMRVVEMFPPRARTRAGDRSDFWLHSLATACMASHMARMARYAQPEEAFIAGLLHDIGKLVLDECFEELFHDIVELAADDGSRTLDVEREVIGVGHPQIGSTILERWKLPRLIRDAVHYHHEPGRASEAMSGNDLVLARLVSMADLVAKALGAGGSGDRVILEPTPEAWPEAGLPLGIQRKDLGPVYRELNIFREFLQLGGTEMAPPCETEARKEGRILYEDEHCREVSVLRLFLELQGYTVLAPGAHAGVEADLCLVEAASKENLEFLRARAGSVGPEGGAVPLVVLGDGLGLERPGPDGGGAEARLGPTPLRAACDARVLQETLDTLLLGKAVEPPPVIPPEALRAEEAALQRELKHRLQAQGRTSAAPAAVTTAHTPTPTPTPTHTLTLTPPPPPPARRAAVKPLVLVVDEEAQSRIGMMQILSAQGLRVSTAASGLEALQLLGLERPSLAILDLGLSDMDGFRVLARLREPGSEVPVVVCSLRRDRETIVRAAGLGVVGYLAKPVKPEALAAKVQSLLAR